MYQKIKSIKLLLSLLALLTVSKTLSAQNGNFPFYEYVKLFEFGDIMPKDQGGKFIQVELLNTEQDAIIVHKIRDGLLYRKYGNPINWIKYEKTEIETSVWINRLYFLPSFARMYYITGDKSFANDMMEIIKTWFKDNPRIPGEERRTFNWRDMQVAWRSIHLSWCYYLTKDALSADDKKLIETIQKEHASALMSWFAKQELNDFNHQSHGALAMLYLSTLFKSTDPDGQLESNALRILNHHLKHAHYPDGGNIEQMFGYFPFQTSIFRDMYLLCKANGIKYPENLIPMLGKMADYMSHFAQPNETMPPLNDSYEMTIIPSIVILNKILNTETPTRYLNSAYYPDTQVAVMRSARADESGSWYLLLNPAKRVGSHSHAGRLGLYLWYNGKPVLIEAGCCNYDKRIKNRWYRTSKAHNTVLINGIQDAESSSDIEYARKRETGNRIIEWVDNPVYKYSKMISPANDPVNSNTEWTREVALVGDEFAVVLDAFRTQDKNEYEILFHTPPVELAVNQKTKEIAIYNDSLITIVPLSKHEINDISITQEYFYLNGEDLKAPMITYKTKGEGYKSNILLFLPAKSNICRDGWQTEETKSGIGVKLKTKTGGEKVLLFKNSQADEVNIFGFSTKNSFEYFEKK